MPKLTDKTELTASPADDDIGYIVDVSDTTDSAEGTSKKIKWSTRLAAIFYKASIGWGTSLFSYLSFGSTKTVKMVVKGVNKENEDGTQYSLAVVDSSDRIVSSFSNSGRMNLLDYAGQGGVLCLYNCDTTPTNNQVAGHYAYGTCNAAGNLHTAAYIQAIVTDVSTASMDSQLQFFYMKDKDTTSGYQQPNASMTLDKTALRIQTGIQILNKAGNGYVDFGVYNNTSYAEAKYDLNAGYLTVTSLLYLRDSVQILNKAASSFISILIRDTTGSEAVMNMTNIGTVASGKVSATKTTGPALNASTWTPSSATDSGTTGDIAWDTGYIYVCTATNSWKRTAISAW